MSSEIKISVILPVKNGAKYIRSCIQSFLIQEISYGQMELIVVDDHSSDNTMNVLKENFLDTSNVVILKNNGEGIIDALQTGYAKSNGNYISRMDADDIMPERKFEHLLKVILNDNAEVATGKVKYFHYEREEVGDGFLKYEKWLNALVDEESYYREIYKECVVASPNWLIGKKDFERAGGFSGNYPEDYDLVFRWYKNGLSIKGTDHVTHHWYDHSQRASRNDDHYKENNFFDLKLRWFYDIDRDGSRGLVIYGAGNKGKYLAKKIVERGEEPIWCSNNSKKIAKSIYGLTLISDQEDIESMDCQIIVAIAVEEDKLKIKKRFSHANLIEGKDYFFFS